MKKKKRNHISNLFLFAFIILIGSLITFCNDMGSKTEDRKVENYLKGYDKDVLQKYQNNKHANFLVSKWYNDNKEFLVETSTTSGNKYKYVFKDGGELELHYTNEFRDSNLESYLKAKYGEDETYLTYTSYWGKIDKVKERGSSITKIPPIYEISGDFSIRKELEQNTEWDEKEIVLNGLTCTADNMHKVAKNLTHVISKINILCDQLGDEKVFKDLQHIKKN